MKTRLLVANFEWACEMEVVRYRNETRTLKHLLGQGGQGRVYRMEKGLAVKVLDSVDVEHGFRLKAMVENPPRPLFEKRGLWGTEVPCFAWPLEPIFDPDTGDIKGFVMPLVPKEMAPLALVSNPKGRIREISKKWLLHAAYSLSLRVYWLAYSGYLLADLNLQNEFVNRHAQCCVIDTDSLYFTDRDGKTYPCHVGVTEFQAPELIGVRYGEVPRDKSQIAWSLLVMVHLLLRHQHPFSFQWNGKLVRPPLSQVIRDGIYPETGRHKDYAPHPSLVPKDRFPCELIAMFRKMFVDGYQDATLRPTILEIVQLLKAMCKKR